MRIWTESEEDFSYGTQGPVFKWHDRTYLLTARHTLGDANSPISADGFCSCKLVFECIHMDFGLIKVEADLDDYSEARPVSPKLDGLIMKRGCQTGTTIGLVHGKPLDCFIIRSGEIFAKAGDSGAAITSPDSCELYGILIEGNNTTWKALSISAVIKAAALPQGQWFIRRNL